VVFLCEYVVNNFFVEVHVYTAITQVWDFL
jgi:hypothetical protein